MKTWIAGISVALLAWSGVAAASPPGEPQYLLGVSKQDHTLAIVDYDTLRVVARVPLGPEPHEVIASEDGTTAYVSNAGLGRAEGFFSEINVVDLAGKKALANIDTGALSGPHGLDFVGGKLWFTSDGAKAVARYDPKIGKVDWIMGTAELITHMISVSRDQQRIFTSNNGSGTISIIDRTLLPPLLTPFGDSHGEPYYEWVQTVLPTGKVNEGFDVTPDGKELWNASAADGFIYIADTHAKKIVDKIDAKVLGANHLKITPDGRYAFVTSVRSNDLVVYDVGTRKLYKRIPLGAPSTVLVMDPARQRAFVSSKDVAVIDLRTFEVTGHVDIGPDPNGLALAPRRAGN